MAYCCSLLQPDADLSYEVPSPVSSEASEGWLGASGTRGRGSRGRATERGASAKGPSRRGRGRTREKRQREKRVQVLVREMGWKEPERGDEAEEA